MSLCMNGTNGPMWRGTACITSSSFQHIVKSAIWKNSSRKRKSISRIVQSVWHKVGERACNVRSYPYELEYLPRYGVAQVIGRLKGKSAILIHKRCLGRNLAGYYFRARGHCVGTVGFDEATVRAYIYNQEEYENIRINIYYLGNNLLTVRWVPPQRGL